VTLPRRGSATHLGAETGSAGAAGVRRGSSCRYQTPRLTKNSTSTSKICTSRIARQQPWLLPPRLAPTTSRLANLAPRNSQLPARIYQTRTYPLATTRSQLPNQRLPTRSYQLTTINPAPTHLQLPARNYQTRASPLAATSSQLPIPCLPSRTYQLALPPRATTSRYHLVPRLSRPDATKFKSRDPPLPKSKPWPSVAIQDRVFPHYVPNSSIKHSKSDSKDRSQEIL
jgi:hypothetical protein